MHDICPGELIGSSELVMRTGKQWVERAMNPVARILVSSGAVEFDK